MLRLHWFNSSGVPGFFSALQRGCSFEWIYPWVSFGLLSCYPPRVTLDYLTSTDTTSEKYSNRGTLSHEKAMPPPMQPPSVRCTRTESWFVLGLPQGSLCVVYLSCLTMPSSGHRSPRVSFVLYAFYILSSVMGVIGDCGFSSREKYNGKGGLSRA